MVERVGKIIESEEKYLMPDTMFMGVVTLIKVRQWLEAKHSWLFINGD